MLKKEAAIISHVLHDNLAAQGTALLSASSTHCLTVAFVGSGPLPLTGILLALHLNANVILIDCDSDAVQLSLQLVREWENKCILPENRVTVISCDACNLTFASKPTSPTTSQGKAIYCDVLFVAALIPNAVKESLAQKVGKMGADGPLVVLRTAHGLTARLAYFPSHRNMLRKHLHFVGVVAPLTHHIGNGAIVDDEELPLDFFPTEILNSLEIYQGRWHEE